MKRLMLDQSLRELLNEVLTTDLSRLGNNGLKEYNLMEDE